MNLIDKLKNLFNSKFYWLLAGLALFETASYFGYLFPNLETLFFYFAAAVTLILSLKNIKYGVWLAIIELLIGSKGYLLAASINGTQISIRIIIWLIVLSVWLGYFISSLFKKDPEKKSVFLRAETYRQNYIHYFFILFFFIAVGLIVGLVKQNGFTNIFFDFNGWLYFAFLFPFFESILNKNISSLEPLLPIFKIFFAAMSWLFLKTFFLLFLFSHASNNTTFLLMKSFYRWVRETGVGEITMMESGFVRIFFQSHIFILAAFCILTMAIIKFWEEIKINKKLLTVFILLQAAITSVIIISFSRSFWVGLIAASPLFILIAWKKYGLKKIFSAVAITIFSVMLAAGLIAGVTKFPFPKPGIDFNLASALNDRAKNISNEAAASSRYTLLPELWREIKNNLLLGGGFGRTVSYRSSDPRVLESSADGNYTTYAFEWGWLDVWLKIGLFGAVFYLFFFGKLIIDAIKKNNWLIDSLAISLLILATVNFFTPYVNHPLGIGLFLFAAGAIYLYQKLRSCV